MDTDCNKPEKNINESDTFHFFMDDSEAKDFYKELLEPTDEESESESIDTTKIFLDSDEPEELDFDKH